jgi:hypothetical protein
MLKKINNLGDGNCMYYAYAISLMYYLRAETKPSQVKAVLARFPKHQKTLKEMISRNQDKTKPFNEKDLHLIQQLLGPACRELASKSVMKEFLADPTQSQILANVTWKLRAELSKSSNVCDLKALLNPEIDNTAQQENFSSAAIFGVKSITAAIKKYATEISKELTDYLRSFDKTLTKNEVNKAIDLFIQEKTIYFFTQNKNANLKKYARYLNTDKIWGTEETLLSLHRSVTGEKNIRNKAGQIEFIRTVDLELAINKNNDINPQPISDIILNNENNTHWTSIIPNKCLNPPVMTPSTHTNKHDTPLVSEVLNKMGVFKKEYKTAIYNLITQIDKHGIKSNIEDINTAQADINETDEDFAKRLQIAEIEFFRMK